jgi:hypothetical protein
MKRGKEEGERGNENVPGSNDRTVARVRDLLEENLHRHEGRSETGTDDELRNHEQGKSLALELRDAGDATKDGTDEHGRSVPLYERSGRKNRFSRERGGKKRREKREGGKESEGNEEKTHLHVVLTAPLVRRVGSDRTRDQSGDVRHGVPASRRTSELSE